MSGGRAKVPTTLLPISPLMTLLEVNVIAFPGHKRNEEIIKKMRHNSKCAFFLKINFCCCYFKEYFDVCRLFITIVLLKTFVWRLFFPDPTIDFLFTKKLKSICYFFYPKRRWEGGKIKWKSEWSQWKINRK